MIPTIKNTKKARKLFFPTLENAKSFWVWFSLVLFFSLYDIFSQFQYLDPWTEVFTLLFKTFVSNFCIIFGTVGYLHFSVKAFETLTIKEQLVHISLVNMLMTPIMTLVAKVIVFLVLQDVMVFQNILLEMVINTFLALLVTALLVYYFVTQYQSITTTQHHYQQRLLEQNAQLKARITPHFFFNMLNTLISLIESEPREATNVINHVSRLYRFSFNEPKEIALTDEIQLCEEYLAIEQYRFGDRLQVIWDLPDEDTVYDMVITSLTLQMLLEKVIVAVVEITNESIYINISVRWENNLVTIIMTANLPINIPQGAQSRQQVNQHLIDNLDKNLSFQAQQDNLQRYFGDTATISSHVETIQEIPNKLMIQIQYPLIDVS